MRHYCIYFSNAYFTRGIALYNSLIGTEGSDFTLWIMCLEAKAYEVLTNSNLSNVKVLSLKEIENFDSDFFQTNDRPMFEYYCSCKPVLMLYLLKCNPSIKRITYLDSDLFFFGDTEGMHREIDSSSIALSPHRFVINIEKSEQVGIFNAGWISIKNDRNGVECLEWWRKKVFEWCKDIVENDRYADQKYLDQVPLNFQGVRIVQHLGINAGPWNIKNKIVEESGCHVHINGVALIFYHFHGIRRVGQRIYDTGVSSYNVRLLKNRGRNLYRRYLNELQRIDAQFPEFASEFIPPRPNDHVGFQRSRILFALHNSLRIAKRILYAAYILRI